MGEAYFHFYSEVNDLLPRSKRGCVAKTAQEQAIASN
jgi:hypothetical protein